MMRLKYPEEAKGIRDDDSLVIISRRKERVIPPKSWWINRRTPVGEDAELFERKPYGGRKLISYEQIIAVIRGVK